MARYMAPLQGGHRDPDIQQCPLSPLPFGTAGWADGVIRMDLGDSFAAVRDKHCSASHWLYPRATTWWHFAFLMKQIQVLSLPVVQGAVKYDPG